MESLFILNSLFFHDIYLLIIASNNFQDPRLLGEIHVALLRSIIKDIEDVARTPSSGVGTNQNSAANPGGGHPQIVEGVSSNLWLIYFWFPFLDFMICFFLCFEVFNIISCIRHIPGVLIFAAGSAT